MLIKIDKHGKKRKDAGEYCYVGVQGSLLFGGKDSKELRA
jgi:hypothetical protein